MSWKLLLVTLTTAAFAGGAVGGAYVNDRCRTCRHGVVTHTKLVMRDLDSAIIHYQTENTDRCPGSLATLVQDRYMTTMPLDGWGQPLVFVCPGVHNPDGADIISAGSDHIFGTADDINSWEL